MIIGKRENGTKFWYKSGRNGTPFTTVNLSRAKGELTRESSNPCYNLKIVKISDVEEI